MSVLIDRLEKQFLARRLNPVDIQSKILNSEETDWINPADNTRNPNYQKGDNSIRQAGFTHNPNNTMKGQYFQHVLKPVVTKMIDMVHGGLKRIYDQDIYKFDDPRLQDINSFAKEFILDNFADDPPKLERMNKLKDIILGIIKEDPFYSSAGFWLFNCFVDRFSNGFEMSQAQKDCREMSHMREFYCYKCKKIHKGIPTRMQIDNQGNYMRDDQGRLKVGCYGGGGYMTIDGTIKYE